MSTHKNKPKVRGFICGSAHPEGCRVHVQEQINYTIDLVIYSLAAPRRAMQDGHVFNSCIKTTESSFVNKTLDLSNNTIKVVTIPAATEDEIASTIKVMGGEDWFL